MSSQNSTQNENLSTTRKSAYVSRQTKLYKMVLLGPYPYVKFKHLTL